VAEQLSALSGVIPGGGMDIISDQIKRLTSNGTSKLGFGLLISIATSLWSANQAIKALFDSLNVVFSIAAGVKGDLLTSRAFLHFIDLRGLMSPHGALASLRGWRAAAS
jgi:uncharacterized BrkB/YihY/UPF0761 family membrane protein